MYLINTFEHVNEYSGGILAFVFFWVECVWLSMYFCRLRLEGSVSLIILVDA